VKPPATAERTSCPTTNWKQLRAIAASSFRLRWDFLRKRKSRNFLSSSRK